MASSSSTMAKLLLQNKLTSREQAQQINAPPQNQLSSLSTSASLRSVLAGGSGSTSAVVANNNNNNANVNVVPQTTTTTTINVISHQYHQHQQQQQHYHSDPSSVNAGIGGVSSNANNRSAATIVTAQPVLIRFSEQQLAELSLKELNHYLRGLSKDEAAEVKRMRRAAKNKSYAVVQREKRQDDVQRLSARKLALTEEISAVKFRKTRVADELNRVRKETNGLLALAKKLKLQVPAHIYDLRSQSASSPSTSSAAP